MIFNNKEIESFENFSNDFLTQSLHRILIYNPNLYIETIQYIDNLLYFKDYLKTINNNTSKKERILFEKNKFLLFDLIKMIKLYPKFTNKIDIEKRIYVNLIDIGYNTQRYMKSKEFKYNPISKEIIKYSEDPTSEYFQLDCNKYFNKEKNTKNLEVCELELFFELKSFLNSDLYITRSLLFKKEYE